MGKNKLNIVVACVANKSLDIPPDLQFRNIKLDTIPNMADLWINKLKSSNSPIIEANKLYSGAAWTTLKSAKTISDSLSNFEIDWYIMSVGYGLIKWNQQIKPYSITFSKPSFDGLRKRVLKQKSNTEWWDYITTTRNLQISDITSKETPTMILGSTEYINAIREDLNNSQNFMIFSSNYNARYFLDRHIKTHEKLRFITGGGKADNNARNLKFVLEHIDEWGCDLDNINSNLSSIISNIKQELPKSNFNREPISEEEAKKVILNIGLDKPMSHYISKIRNELNKKISEQVIISYIQELKNKRL
mgnify:CR=1 FL=1|jgi:cytoplasmic iron level regulating protein YaaA (DUF328/UPF0246 family)